LALELELNQKLIFLTIFASIRTIENNAVCSNAVKNLMQQQKIYYLLIKSANKLLNHHGQSPNKPPLKAPNERRQKRKKIRADTIYGRHKDTANKAASHSVSVLSDLPHIINARCMCKY
jgi:hypothetical protein